MNYSIQTWQDGKQLLGSDYSSFVKDAKSKVKLENAISAKVNTLRSLVSINPYLKTSKVEIFVFIDRNNTSDLSFTRDIIL